MVRSKKQLAVILSKLKGFDKPNIKLEQYQTPSDIAAEWVWQMALASEVEEKVIADFACGPGIIGMALLIMGAKKIHFLDCDKNIIEICKENYNYLQETFEGVGEAEFHLCDIKDFKTEETIDFVVENPPFGTKEKHVDKKFLEQAFKTSKIVYSMHKSTTENFVRAISKDHKFQITHKWFYKFPLPRTMKHHKKEKEFVDVDLWRMELE